MTKRKAWDEFDERLMTIHFVKTTLMTNEERLWLYHMGYLYIKYGYYQLRQTGKRGKLSKQRINRGADHVVDFLKRKYPNDFLVWRTLREINK